ncbi:hypothetical protein [Galbibacter pacificus]|uniref:Collagen-like protein n=1 Tax=Galbibacter pacificus TaxID=2996052 RepID=A0ABT6FPJ0_9FLAO|nr:hypothetical protein [Galbibacter pacificus]MDG3582351.1 hypothetical protein [Galbibacter pacificus]MDG3585173.1 hypothetical protein [Galbibacter pacificus]
MKKIFTLLFVSVFAFTACEGPEGPEGPPGEDGVNIVGETFEYSNINFSSQNDYTFSDSYDPPLVEGDVMLVYRLEGIENGLKIWEPLPTVFFNSDTGDDLRHRFNFTNVDVEIIIESSNFSAFGPDLLSNQSFRVVIVPSDLINSVDTSNIDAVMKAANIKSVQKLN